MIKTKELYRQLEHATTIDDKIDIYKELSIEFLNRDAMRSREIAEEMLALSLAAKHERGIAEAYNALGRIEFKAHCFPLALQHFETALEHVVHSDHILLVCQILVAIGMVHFNLGNLDIAEEYYERTLMLGDHTEKNRRFRAHCFNNIGNVKLHRGELDNAEEYYLKSIELLNVDIDERPMILNVKGNLAIVYERKGEFEKAMTLFYECLEGFHNAGHKVGEAHTLVNIANCYSKMNDHAEAIRYFQQAQKLIKPLNNRSLIADMNNGLGETYRALKGYKEALEHLDIAEQINTELQRPDHLCNTWRMKAKVYREIGKIEEADEMICKVRALAAEKGLHDQLDELEKTA